MSTNIKGQHTGCEPIYVPEEFVLTDYRDAVCSETQQQCLTRWCQILPQIDLIHVEQTHDIRTCHI